MHARFMKWGTALALSAVMVVGSAGASGASVDTKGNKAKFCKQAGNLSADVNPADGSGYSEETAADLEKALNKLSKQAPTKKLEQATKDMATYFGELADGPDPEDISTSTYEDFGIASGRFGLYLATKCIGELIPDITIPSLPDLPDISLPDISLPDLNT